MTIKARLIGVLITIIILMCGAIISQNIAKHKNEEQNQKSTSRYLSYLLADEFRKTSMDLTRLGRSYVATGAQQHWDEYWNIVKWRNGDIDRPSYVDVALYRGERKKQSDIMQELKFSTSEFALLKQASDNSNTLIDTETQAMESIRQGRFVEGPFKPFPDESVKQFALRIIFNDDYHSEVNKIMTPVSAFFKALDNRTASDLKQSQDTAAKWLGISLTTQVVVLLLIMLLMFILIKMLFKPLKQAINAMLNIGEGEGDLSKRLHESGRDELSSLGRGFNLFASHVQDVIVELRISIDEISNSSLALNSTANLTDEAVIQQKNSIEQLLIAIEQMLPAVQEVAQNAVYGVKQANLSDEAATDGLMVVEQAISNINLLDDDIDNAASVINQLAQDTNNIGAVLDVIRGISDQTNLLALNAAIEAARAGEAGRGFAVVADEVRTLAQRTQDSTLEIQQMIEKLQIGASNAVEVMDQSKNRTSACVDNTRHAGESLNKITASVAAITDINNQIASATEEQNATIDEIRRNVDNINQHVEQTAEGSQETARNSEFTTALTGKIKSLVDQFKTA